MDGVIKFNMCIEVFKESTLPIATPEDMTKIELIKVWKSSLLE